MPTFSIRGHEVHFPHQPYGVQFSFMEKMLRTLNEGANALLEAPTGCGKTLSLLCAALAWQEQRKKELRDRKLAKLTKVSSPGEQGGKTPRAQSGGAYGDANDDDDFLGPAAGERKGQRQRSSGSGSASGSPEGGAAAKGKGGIDDDDLIRGGGAGPMDVDFGDGEEEEEADAKPPRIYFATRTHSQIAQVVRELKRSGYQPAMAILVGQGVGGEGVANWGCSPWPYFYGRTRVLSGFGGWRHRHPRLAGSGHICSPWPCFIPRPSAPLGRGSNWVKGMVPVAVSISVGTWHCQRQRATLPTGFCHGMDSSLWASGKRHRGGCACDLRVQLFGALGCGA